MNRKLVIIMLFQIILDHRYRLSELTKLRPSVLCSYVLQEKLHEWVKEYAKKAMAWMCATIGRKPDNI